MEGKRKVVMGLAGLLASAGVAMYGIGCGADLGELGWLLFGLNAPVLGMQGFNVGEHFARRQK